MSFSFVSQPPAGEVSRTRRRGRPPQQRSYPLERWNRVQPNQHYESPPAEQSPKRPFRFPETAPSFEPPILAPRESDGRIKNLHAEFYRGISGVIAARKGRRLANWLDLGGNVTATPRFPVSPRETKIHGPFGSLVAAYMNYLQRNRTPKSLLSLMSALEPCLRTDDPQWLLPVVRNITRAVANSSKYSGEREQEEVSRLMLNLCNLCTSERSGTGKRIVGYVVACELFKVYRRLDNYARARSLIDNIQRDELDLSNLTKKDRTTYNFQKSRVQLVHSHINDAYHSLKYAFLHAPARCYRNKRLILFFFTIASLIVGVFPNLNVLKKYNLHGIFEEIIRGYRLGHWSRVRAGIERHATVFLRFGVYMVLVDKLPLIVARNLARKVCHYTAPFLPDGSPPQVQLAAFADAMRLSWGQDLSVDLPDAEAVCVALIDQGLAMGYLSHQRGTFVFKRHEMFPRLVFD